MFLYFLLFVTDHVCISIILLTHFYYLVIGRLLQFVTYFFGHFAMMFPNDQSTYELPDYLFFVVDLHVTATEWKLHSPLRNSTVIAELLSLLVIRWYLPVVAGGPHCFCPFLISTDWSGGTRKGTAILMWINNNKNVGGKKPERTLWWLTPGKTGSRLRDVGSRSPLTSAVISAIDGR